MGTHEQYGKRLIREIAGSDFHEVSPRIDVDYGAGKPARIDGTVGRTVAVEIEARVPKQVRGAIMDLICHRYPKKLLIVMEENLQNAETATQQFSNIFSKFLDESDFEVVLLSGSGSDQEMAAWDSRLVFEALQRLGYTKEPTTAE